MTEFIKPRNAAEEAWIEIVRTKNRTAAKVCKLCQGQADHLGSEGAYLYPVCSTCEPIED
jgi:hypothetical protein